jgi:hypothetical protein
MALGLVFSLSLMLQTSHDYPTSERRWILVKARDDHARPGSDIVAEQPGSVRSGRTWQDLANE